LIAFNSVFNENYFLGNFLNEKQITYDHFYVYKQQQLENIKMVG